MSIVADAFRPFWLLGLNDVSGIHSKGISGWICDEEFQIYDPVTPSAFLLNVSNPGPLLEAYAADINRIAVASFETLNAVARSSTFPKSTAWLVIKTYYAAFFAAHALLRMLGTSCEPLEHGQVTSIQTVADLYGYAPAKSLMGGLYHIVYDPTASKVSGLRLRSMGVGPHEGFWLTFHDRIDKLSTEVLTTNIDTVANRQLVSTKLSELAANLSFGSSGKGRWLAAIRNSVNYGQKYATWYPYAGQKPYYPRLFEKTEEWRDDPEDLDLTSHEGKDFRRFQVTCNFIIAALRSSIAEMARRCSVGESFHSYGSLGFLNLQEQRVANAR